MTLLRAPVLPKTITRGQDVNVVVIDTERRGSPARFEVIIVAPGIWTVFAPYPSRRTARRAAASIASSRGFRYVGRIYRID